MPRQPPPLGVNTTLIAPPPGGTGPGQVVVPGPLGPMNVPTPPPVIATQSFSAPVIQIDPNTGVQPLTSQQQLAIAQAANAASNALLAAGTIQSGAQVTGIPIRDANGNITGYNYTSS